MAMLNRPLQKTEIEALMRAPPLRNFGSMFDRDPWPLMVHYRVGLEDSNAQFTPREVYRVEGTGPSDCVWIVPGTAQRGC